MTFRRKPLHITPQDAPSADDSTDIKVKKALRQSIKEFFCWPFKNVSRSLAFLSTVGLFGTYGWDFAKTRFTAEAHTETQNLRNEIVPRVDRIETKVDTLIDFMGAKKP